MEIIGVSGNINSLTSDINLVYNLTNVGKESPKSITDKLVSQYMADFRKKVSKKLRQTEMQPEEEANYRSVLELESEETELEVQNIEPDLESSELEIQKNETVTNDVMSENENEILDTQNFQLENQNQKLEGQNFFMALAKQSSNTVEHGVYLEDLPSVEKVDTPSGINPVDSREYVDHGVYLDELSLGDATESNTDDYVEHGVYLEDISNDDKEDEVVVEDTVAEGEFEEHGVYLEDVVLDKEVQFTSEDITQDEYDYEEVNEEVSTDISNDVEPIKESEKQDKRIELPKSQKPITDSVSSIKKEDKSSVRHKNTVKKPVAPKLPTAQAAKTEDHSVPKVSPPIMKVPSNIRDFVKSCNGKRCPVSEALKYYTKEQLQKALKLGKIQEHRGMLSV